MEQAPEDQGPAREPVNAWALELLEELKAEAVRHFPRNWLQALGQYIYETYGDTWEGVIAITRILQQIIFTHYRIGCQHSRIGIIPSNARRRGRRDGSHRS
uniref:Protein Vpr n=1 Tax=Human immunodeficiency virus type 1 TaxID=11676 RepID=Q909R6_HV1|nr:vpr protein [Human immunodeficiency virus 1]